MKKKEYKANVLQTENGQRTQANIQNGLSQMVKFAGSVYRPKAGYPADTLIVIQWWSTKTGPLPYHLQYYLRSETKTFQVGMDTLKKVSGENVKNSVITLNAVKT